MFDQGRNDRIRTDDGYTHDTANRGRGDTNVAVIGSGDTAAANCEDSRVNFTGSTVEFATASSATILAESDSATKP